MKLYLSLIFGFFCFYNLMSQGCSDAGFCTLNSLNVKKSDSLDSKYTNQIKIGGSYGKADHDIQVISSFIEYHKEVSSKTSADIKLAFSSQNGETVSGLSISNFNVSDLYLNVNWKIVRNMQFTFGFKVPLQDGNMKIKGAPAPLDYQASLGTFDAIFGVAYNIKNIYLFLAAQQPLTQNKNSYLNCNGNEIVYNLQSTNKFERNGDILLRISYPIQITNKFSINPSLLPIYHLKDDTYFDSCNNRSETITGSKGITVNGNLFLGYDLTRRNRINVSAGFPLVVRDVRPDGLTRKFVAGLEYQFRF
ncbi:MAG: hypothetical protein IPG12_05225 [Saprospiraceae bacterium]|nr:hypothetical protein [Saprospiraceae bacterium]